jgi:hypothetical protein
MPLIFKSYAVRCAAMRKTLSAVALAVGLVGAVPAAAGTGSFANRSLGLGIGGFKFLGETDGISWGLPVTLEGGYYIESGFDLYLRVPLMILYQNYFVTPQGGGGVVFGTGGQFGVRYLFLEEDVRPYLNLHLAGIYIVRDVSISNFGNFFFGPGVGGGLDYFVGESIAIGARVYVDMFINFNQPLRWAIGGGANFSTYF